MKRLKKYGVILLTLILSLSQLLSCVPSFASVNPSSHLSLESIKSESLISSEETVQAEFHVKKDQADKDKLTYTLPEKKWFTLKFPKQDQVIKFHDKIVAHLTAENQNLTVKWENSDENFDANINLDIQVINKTRRAHELHLAKEKIEVLPKEEARAKDYTDDSQLIQQVYAKKNWYEPNEKTSALVEFVLPDTMRFHKDDVWKIKVPSSLELADQSYTWKDKTGKDLVHLSTEGQTLILKVEQDQLTWKGKYNLQFTPKNDTCENQRVSWLDADFYILSGVSQEGFEKDSSQSSSQEMVKKVDITKESSSLDVISTTSTEHLTSETTSTKNVQTLTTMSKQEKKKVHSSKMMRARIQPRARSLNDAGVVSSINISPKNIIDGERVTVQVNLKERYPHQIQPGDTLTFTFPKSSDGQVYLQGYNGKLDIQTSSGVVIGTLNVDSNQAVLTFNDNVEEEYDVASEFHFQCQARNLHHSEHDVKTSLPTNLGIPTVTQQTITITSPGTEGIQPGKQPFYYKIGDMFPNDTSHVQWWLSANMNYDLVRDNIYIEDAVQGGQEIEWNTMRISFHGGRLNGKSFSVQQLRNKGYGEIDDLGNGKFQVIITRDAINDYSTGKGSQVTISYKTRITDFNQKGFTNNSKIWYQNWDGSDAGYGKESNHTVKNISIGGSGSMTERGNIKVHKADSKTGKALLGAEFTLTGGPDRINESKITNEKGELEFKVLKFGTYTLQETKAPNGYKLNNKKYIIQLNPDRSITIKNPDSMIQNSKGTLIIKNTHNLYGPKLPNTGGKGNFPFYLISFGLLGGVSLFLLVYVWKRKSKV